ncbi:hypothetical protein PFLL34_00346 [Pseudomonas fluorescens]|nr:hypothetical protein PFLL34_00346 [Pseudomonas fluorescens]SFY28012.1 hypothetical protein SAMN03159398_05100 [Pseudomonas sp. NFPP02]
MQRPYRPKVPLTLPKYFLHTRVGHTRQVGLQTVSNGNTPEIPAHIRTPCPPLRIEVKFHTAQDQRTSFYRFSQWQLITHTARHRLVVCKKDFPLRSFASPPRQGASLTRCGPVVGSRFKFKLRWQIHLQCKTLHRPPRTPRKPRSRNNQQHPPYPPIHLSLPPCATAPPLVQNAPLAPRRPSAANG